jgi:hypothetical protein
MSLQVAEIVVFHVKDHHKLDLNAFSYSSNGYENSHAISSTVKK